MYFWFLDRENIYIHQMCTPPYMLTPPPPPKKKISNECNIDKNITHCLYRRVFLDILWHLVYMYFCVFFSEKRFFEYSKLLRDGYQIDSNELGYQYI